MLFGSRSISGSLWAYHLGLILAPAWWEGLTPLHRGRHRGVAASRRMVFHFGPSHQNSLCLGVALSETVLVTETAAMPLTGAPPFLARHSRLSSSTRSLASDSPGPFTKIPPARPGEVGHAPHWPRWPRAGAPHRPHVGSLAAVQAILSRCLPGLFAQGQQRVAERIGRRSRRAPRSRHISPPSRIIRRRWPARTRQHQSGQPADIEALIV